MSQKATLIAAFAVCSAASSCFHEITDESHKRKTPEGIANQLATSDPQAALALIDSNSTYVTENVMKEFVGGVSKENPTLDANYIVRIQSERERNTTYRNTCGNGCKFTWIVLSSG